MGKKSDPKNCFLCGKRGIPGIGSRLQCPDCEVTWMPYGKIIEA